MRPSRKQAKRGGPGEDGGKPSLPRSGCDRLWGEVFRKSSENRECVGLVSSRSSPAPRRLSRPRAQCGLHPIELLPVVALALADRRQGGLFGTGGHRRRL